jgi:hypothetical protein
MTKTIDEQIAQLTDRLAEVSARIEVIAQERQARERPSQGGCSHAIRYFAG